MATDKQFLPWHQSQFETVLKHHQQGRLSHAYLLQGTQGLGKFGFALKLSQYFLCESPKENDACHECSSCQLFQAGHHPDLRILAPLEDKKVIGVDQVRESVEFLQKTSNQGGYKVLISPQVELMNINASNALLKTLEEPPERTLMLMVTHQPGLVLATIRSRCQSMLFTLPDKDEALNWLQQQNISGNAEILLKLASGAPLKAIEYADEEWQHIRSQMHAVMTDLLKGKTNVVSIVNSMERSSLELNLETILLSVQDLLRHAQSRDAFPLYDSDLNELNEALPKNSLLALHKFYQELISTRKILSKGVAINARLSLETLLLSWSKLASP